MTNRLDTGQKWILWAALSAFAGLAGLSVVGALLKPNQAAEAWALFNSAPLAVFWFLLAGLLPAGLICFPRLLRSPASLAVHVGCLLVLAGSMWGSERGHAAAARLLGIQKVRTGLMILDKGETSDRVLNRRERRVEGRLPFQLRLEDFWIEYDPLKREKWDLGVGAWRPGQDDGEPSRKALIDWAVGRETPVPFTQARIKVLRYLPHAQPVFDANGPFALEIGRPDGNSLLLPARVGAEASLAESNITVRIVRVLSRLTVADGDEVVDAPDSAGPPALELRIDRPGDANRRAFAVEWGLARPVPGVRREAIRYRLPPVVGAREIKQGPPAMEVLLAAGDRRERHWLIPRAGWPHASLPLCDLLGLHAHAGRPHAPVTSASQPEDEHEELVLYLLRPTPTTKAHKSHVVVLEDGLPQAARIIEENRPLHYGGYHFGQQDYDHEGERYTVLSVTSDSGLYAVYAGFALVLLGVFRTLWARSAAADATATDGPAHRLARLGFPLLTLGLVLGAVWGKRAWGDYWNWDAKELLSLASWLVYVAYFHWRGLRGRRFPRANAALLVLGLAGVMVTLLWVSLSGVSRLHSYASPEGVLRIKAGWLGGLLVGAAAAYVLAAVAFLLKGRAIAWVFFAAGFALALAAVAKQWVDADHLPLQSLFEVFLFLGMLAFPASILWRLHLRARGQATDAALGFILLFPAAFVFSAEPQPLLPALRSWLFAPHVCAYLLAYVILAKAGVLAVRQVFAGAALPQAPTEPGRQAAATPASDDTGP